MYIDTPYWYVWYVMWQYVWIDHMPLCPTSHILRWVTEVGFNDVLDSVFEETPCGTTVSSPGDIHWYVYTYRYIILIVIFIYIYIIIYIITCYSFIALQSHILRPCHVLNVLGMKRKNLVEKRKNLTFYLRSDIPNAHRRRTLSSQRTFFLSPAADCARFPRPQCFAGNSSA